MAGGLFNLIALGNNNVILTGNPTKTFFKAVYAKYTNFGLQKFRVDYDGMRVLRTSTPSTFNFKIPRNADLLMDSYLVITLPDIWSPILPPQDSTGLQWAPYEFKWIDQLGSMLIQEITITCGSMTLQKYSGDYLLAMMDRDFTSDKKRLHEKMTGHTCELNDPANAFGRLNTYPTAYTTTNQAGAEPSLRGRTLYIPINTWFTLDSRCAFPLVALQYNELQISVTLRPIQELFRVRDVFDYTNNFPYIQPDFNNAYFQMHRFLQTPPDVALTPASYTTTVNDWNADIHLLCTYGFLSEQERKRFAEEDQVYLVKDVFTYRFQNVTGTSRQLLTSSGMIASWMWYLQRNDINLRNEWTNYTNWPYDQLPANLVTSTENGPLYNLNGRQTGLYITGDAQPVNQREILQTMGILFNGDYRENVLEADIYNYVEKYTRTRSYAKDGLYCYNFCLQTDPHEYQPSGAINMSRFKDIQLEVTTYLPPVNPQFSTFNVLCDASGNALGFSGSGSKNALYEYGFDMTVFEERYNILTFIGGNCAMLNCR